MIDLKCGDNLEVLKEYPDNYFDSVITDPPYNASNSNSHFKDNHYMAINEPWDKNFKLNFFDICSGKIKNGGSMLIFCSHHLLGEYLNQKTLKLQQVIHWIKSNPVPAFYKMYAPSVEYCLWFIKKGNPYTFNRDKRFSYKNVFETNVNIWKESNHPTEKHLGIMESLVLTHTNENDKVLDPFLGSGTTGIACLKTGRDFVGIEINPEYFEIAKARINHWNPDAIKEEKPVKPFTQKELF